MKQLPAKPLTEQETATSKWQGNPTNVCAKCSHCLPTYVFPNGMPVKIADVCFLLNRHVDAATNKCLHFRHKARRSTK